MDYHLTSYLMKNYKIERDSDSASEIWKSTEFQIEK